MFDRVGEGKVCFSGFLRLSTIMPPKLGAVRRPKRPMVQRKSGACDGGYGGCEMCWGAGVWSRYATLHQPVQGPVQGMCNSRNGGGRISYLGKAMSAPPPRRSHAHTYGEQSRENFRTIAWRGQEIEKQIENRKPEKKKILWRSFSSQSCTRLEDEWCEIGGMTVTQRCAISHGVIKS